MLEDYNVWLSGAVIIVGTIEWIKGMLKACFKIVVPAWVPSILLPPVCLAVSAAKGGLLWYNALGMLAASEAGYALIWQNLKSLFKYGRPAQKTANESDQ